MTKAVVFGLAVLLAAFIGRGYVENAKARPTQRERQCRFQWMDQATWTAREERLTGECVARRWGVSWPTLNRIVQCESGWWRKAWNPGGPYVGLAQHSLAAWPGRLAYYGPDWWHLKSRWQNSRSALTVTVRMMADVGLSPWSCA